MYGGMRGIRGLVTETSVLDPAEVSAVCNQWRGLGSSETSQWCSKKLQRVHSLAGLGKWHFTVSFVLKWDFDGKDVPLSMLDTLDYIWKHCSV